MSILRSAIVFVASVAVGATALGAQARYGESYQDYSPDAYAYGLPAFVSVVDGYAELERAGESSRDIENVPLEEGDRLRTTRGRAEILFDDGSVIALDEHTTVTFFTATEIELLRGRIRAQWQNRGALTGLTVHTVAGQAAVRARGDYRVTLGESRRGEAEIEVAVSRGSAELANDLGRTLVREGTRALTTASFAPSTPYAFTSPRDEFERWTDGLEADRYGVESARYLPTELRYYGGVFDRYGSWHRHTSYGWVWYPRVSVGWRPYYGGRWTFVVGFGYSWVGGSRWSWPTHHHGRWDRVGSRYFWIPGRPAQHRVVGYAVPRSSYTAPVSYYQRPAALTGRSTSSASRGPQGSSRGPQSSVGGARPGDRSPQAGSLQRPTRTAPTAVPRTLPADSARPSLGRSAPSDGRSPQSTGRGAESTGRSPQSTGRSPQPTSRSPQSAAPAPTRTAPSAVPRSESQRPPSASRTPSLGRSSAPAGRSPESTGRSPESAGRSPQSAGPSPQATRPSAAPAPRSGGGAPRSAPPAASAPPSGSRTPSRSASPPRAGAGGGDQQTGTAVRRRGGG